jgi:hypothetical protein
MPKSVRPGLEWAVVRDRDMLFSVHLGGKPNVRALLPDLLIPERTQGFGQSGAVDIPGDFHRAMTSSRTK